MTFESFFKVSLGCKCFFTDLLIYIFSTFMDTEKNKSSWTIINSLCKSLCCSAMHIRYKLFWYILRKLPWVKSFMSAANLEILSGLTLIRFPEDNTPCHRWKQCFCVVHRKVKRISWVDEAVWLQTSELTLPFKNYSSSWTAEEY